MASKSVQSGQRQIAGRCLRQDEHRLADVELKHEMVRQLLRTQQADAILLQDPAALSWITAGVDLTRSQTDGCQTSIFITDDARLFATNSVDAVQLFEREAFGLGFQLKQREWHQPHSELIADLCRSRRVLSDCGAEGTIQATRPIQQLRQSLTPLEVDRLRRLSRVLVHAVEVTACGIQTGRTESDVAGEVAHRLLRRTVWPARIQVAADGRNQRYRHWGFGEDAIERSAVISCTARRWGLHTAVTRTVSLGRASDRLLNAHSQAVLMHATGMFFSKAGEPVADVWARVQRIYEKFGLPDEWRLADQAELLAYRLSEHQVGPESELRLSSNQVLFWHPSVDQAACGDSVLTGERVECLTGSSKWPAVVVQVRGVPVTCAAILQIPQSATDHGTGSDWEQLVNQLEDVGAGEGDGLGSQWELFPGNG
ncbi:MAG: M24 family metallopeptidase [Planctomyces sp.]